MGLLGLDSQVRGLVALVGGAGALQVRQQVEGDLSVRLGVLNGLVHAGRLGLLGVRDEVGEGPGLVALTNEAGEAGVEHAREKSGLEGGVGVADREELLADPGGHDVLLVAGRLDSISR